MFGGYANVRTFLQSKKKTFLKMMNVPMHLVVWFFSTCWFKYCLELSPDNFTFFQRTICHYWAVNSTVITKEKGHKLILLPSFIFVSLHV